MKKSSALEFYWFGTCLRFLQDAVEGHLVRTDDHGGILDNIEMFLKFSEKFGLVVTKRVALKRFALIIKELKDAAVTVELTSEQATEVREASGEVRITLDAEIQDSFIYLTTPKRLDVKKLLDNVSELFSPDVYNYLPEISRYDFSEAGRCIVFERPTAAAFHIMRGTESVLRFYYEGMIKQNRISTRMWGPVVDDLRKRPKTKMHETLNNHLDNIRASIRNPTQHPEAIYDINEVQDIWALCVDVVNRMIKIIKENKRT